MNKLKLNPVYIKDLRQMVRNPKLPISIGVYLVLLSTLGLSILTGIFSGQDNFTNLKNSFIILYKMVLGFEFGLLIFMIPEITASSITSEREWKTLDLLLSTTMSTYRIVMGKLFSAMSKIMLYAVASLPVIGLVFVIGVIDLYSIGQFFVLLLVTSFFIGSFGILMSVIFTKTAKAMVVTYAGMLLMLMGTIFLVLLDDLLLGNKTHLDFFDLLLLFNPITTIYVMMSEQLGMIGDGLGLLIAINPSENLILNNWLVLSLLIQTLIGICNIFIAGYLLNPLRKK